MRAFAFIQSCASRIEPAESHYWSRGGQAEVPMAREESTPNRASEAARSCIFGRSKEQGFPKPGAQATPSTEFAFVQGARGLARPPNLLVLLLLFVLACGGEEPAAKAPFVGWSMDDIAGANVPRGLWINKPTAQPGYILFSPLSSGTTYLIDNAGQVVHTWESDFAPGCSAYLLDNGHLLRPAREPEVERFSSPRSSA